jgi:Fur family ferric uptake transcriptional regulator
MKNVNQMKAQFKESGKRWTSQRDAIIAAIGSAGEHVSAEEIYLKVRRKRPGIGFATVYRTLKMMKDGGAIHRREFGDGKARFEAGEHPSGHHDHLVCTSCGRVVEFKSGTIERLQMSIVSRRGFVMTGHRLDLFGTCPVCRSKAGRNQCGKAAKGKR